MPKQKEAKETTTTKAVSTNWLAFDIGTTATKAALMDSTGHTIRSVNCGYGTTSGEDGVVEQNAADWWQAVVSASRELDPGPVAGIALTGQMQDVVLADENSDPVRPVILYSDTRARPESIGVNQRLGSERLRTLTGNTQDAGSLLAKLLWLVLREPESLAKSAHVLIGAADYIGLKMTGIAATDTTTASTTGLLDISSRAFLGTDVLGEIGLAKAAAMLPEVRAGGSLLGKLKSPAAKALGLKSGTPVYHGPGDAGATTLGAGSGESGRVYAYLGTSGWVAFTSSRRIAHDTGVFTLAHPHPAKYIYVAPLLTAGGNLEWTRELFGVESFDTLVNEALERTPSNLIYLPYLNGERSPFSDPHARGALIGLSRRHTRADITRAVLEGVVYAYRHALETLIDEPVAGLTLTGGGTRSAGWSRLFADITRLKISIADDAGNVGVRGAVLAAQVLAGQHTDYAPPTFFQQTTLMEPDVTHGDHYEQQYASFRAAYPALKPIFARGQ